MIFLFGKIIFSMEIPAGRPEMRWKNLTKVAFKSILKNRMRSLLTMLGIIIGVGAVIALVSVGKGATASIGKQISSLGTNLLIVRPGSGNMHGVNRGAASLNTLSLTDIKKLNEESTLIKYFSPYVVAQGQVIGNGKNWSTTIQGVSENYLKIKDWPLVNGTFFSERDIKSRRKIAVIGKTVADELFDGQDPIGMRIRIRNIPFRIIGVLTEKGQSMMGDQDDVILAPYSTVLYRMQDGKYLNAIFASAYSVDDMENAQKEIEVILSKSHKIRPGADNDFVVRSQSEILSTVTGVTDMLTMLLGVIAGISLLVGGIGIMNIMLVSVTERTREIGIRMAVGARGKDILIQFLVESVILSLSGGILGIVLGFGLGKILAGAINSGMIIDPVMTVVAFLFSGAVGVFFGFYPARKASGLNPIDALRYE